MPDKLDKASRDDEFDFATLMHDDPTFMSWQCFTTGPHGSGCPCPERRNCICHQLQREKASSR